MSSSCEKEPSNSVDWSTEDTDSFITSLTDGLDIAEEGSTTNLQIAAPVSRVE
jgi:hypothetical protein